MGETCPVVVRDQHFPSMKAAAAHFGRGQRAVSKALRRRGDLETLGLPQGEALKGKMKPARPIRIHRMPPGPERARLRSQSFPGMMSAAADQWVGCAQAEETAA